jgi:hypothetical protein
MRKIVYIGSKAVKADNVAGTGMIWTRGETKDVVDDTKAELLLKHSGVWADANKPFELAPIVGLADVVQAPTPEPEPKVEFMANAGDLGRTFKPVTIVVKPDEFQKLRDKEWIAVFMSPTEADAYALWKKMEEDTAPKRTGPKPQDKETKAGLDGAKHAA